MDAATPIDQQISWVYCDNLPATARFYHEVLGLELALDQGPARIYRTAGNSFIGLCRAFADRTVEPKGNLITLVTHEVDAWYARLTAAGVPTRGAPARHEAFDIYAFFAEDPNGYLIEFQQFLDPAWPAPRS